MKDVKIKICLTTVALCAMLSAVSLQCAAQECPTNTLSSSESCAESSLNSSLGDIDKALTYTPDANTPVLLDSKWKEKAARSLLVSLTTAPPVPAITIHGGSVDLYNANNFSVKPHGKSAQTDFGNPANTIYLNTFATTQGGPASNKTLSEPNNWQVQIIFRKQDGTADPSKTITICPEEDGAGHCVLDGKTPLSSDSVYFEDSGYGQFYSDSVIAGHATYHITEPCGGTDQCDHISQITVQINSGDAPYYVLLPIGRCVHAISRVRKTAAAEEIAVVQRMRFQSMRNTQRPETSSPAAIC